jgi:glycosyltransferase involved in cell wall biosynthesis
MPKPRAIVTVINDLVTDNRVQRTCGVLIECGYDVVLIGRKLPHALPVPDWQYRSIRMRLLFRTGPLFYFFFNLRLFFRLLFSGAELLFANDLDTLLPNFLVSRLKKIPLIYDSHELFCEVPELEQTPLKRKIWESLEAFIVPQLKNCVTVNESIARIFNEKYGVRFHVVRNIPSHSKPPVLKSRKELGLPEDKKVVIMQGSGINIGRGAEELVEAMKLVDGAVLLIIGGGDVWPVLKKKVADLGLSDRVILKNKMPPADLFHYTANADLGISIDKPTNRNYLFSLPNKLFDYIHAGVPVLCSRLPEIEKLVSEFQVGEFIDSHGPEHITERLNELLNGTDLSLHRQNTRKAAAVLNWETEKEKLRSVLLNV